MEEKPEEDAPVDTAKQPETGTSSPSIEVGAESVKNKVCPQCGTVNSLPSVYCYKCGSKLPDTTVQDKKMCAGCHAPNSPISQYCYKCGLQLPDQVGSGYEYIGRFAGFWIRLLAYFIDGIILNIVTSVIMMITFLSIYGSISDFSWFSMIESSGTLDSSFWPFYWLTVLTGLIVETVYYTVATGKWGRTIGKAALRLKVLKPDGSRVSYWRAFGRSWAYILNGFTLGIGFLVIAFTQKKRGLHDYICDTVVIKTD
jgi:uncharacterized RDD family membrane protein YckC/ribosomal protein L40E